VRASNKDLSRYFRPGLSPCEFSDRRWYLPPHLLLHRPHFLVAHQSGPHGRSLQCRPTDNLRVLQLRAMPDIVPVMNVVMHPAMMDAVLLNHTYHRGGRPNQK